MPAWRIDVPPHVAEVIRHLPPEVKRGVKAALRAVAGDPSLGDPLRRDLFFLDYCVSGLAAGAFK
mgnify:CR=1 FL=1